MDRLTQRLAATSISPGEADCHYCSGEYMTKCGCSDRCPTRADQLERLAKYEDTGLTPDEVEAMKAERDRFKARAEAAEKDLENLIKIGPAGCGLCKNGRCWRRNGTEECNPEWRGPQEGANT